jgi:hypothetical protein
MTNEATIQWLRKQRENAAQAIRDLNAGQSIESEGRDVTEVWLPRYERLFERYTRLIETYEQRDRDTTLGENLKFTE